MKSTVYGSFTDELLVNLVQNGDSKAQEILYHRYYDRVIKRCNRFVQNNEDARDCAQDILLLAFNRIETFHNRAKYNTWLFSIADHFCIDRLRRNRSVNYISLSENVDQMDETSSSVDFDYTSNPLDGSLEQIFENIPTEEQQILKMKYLDKKSIKELQQSLNLSASAVKMRLLRAREHAQEAYYLSTARFNPAV